MYHRIRNELVRTTPYFRELKRLWDEGILAKKIHGLNCSIDEGEIIYSIDEKLVVTDE